MIDLKQKSEELENKSAEEVLRWAIGKFSPKIALANSLGAEDMVIVDLLAKIDPSVKIFTLDTGRLYQETYNLIDEIDKKYGIKVDAYFPNGNAVEKMVKENGINLFYNSVEQRKLCCNIRKIEPLKRALSELDAWICGLRREQSVTRDSIDKVENDTANNSIKINPIADWTEAEVWNYIKENDVPYNVLHDQNYPSIGCLPCTRAVQPGEDVRAGRWWWETPESKECGLHAAKKG